MHKLIKKVDFASFMHCYPKFISLGCLIAWIFITPIVQAKNRANDPKDTFEKIISSGKVIYKGIVIDDANLPLAGVNVVVKGEKGIGATTNIQGEFQFAYSEERCTLVFSYVGMKTQEVHVSAGRRITVRMEADATALGETVVTGIYTRKAESFTGSAATYQAEDLKAIGNQNILQSLSSLDPSFIISDNNLLGSNPNAIMDVSINGKTSINGLSDTYSSNPDQPLFILDGFETTLQRISDLSMDRVESVTILKDAASTAIYGAKAANGVIVVETKKPEAGKLRFSYNGSYQMAWPDLSDYNLMNAGEKLQFEKKSGFYGALDNSGEIISDAKRALYYARLKNVVAGLDSYWMNEPLRTALTHEHSISAEGGDTAFRYGLTLRYKSNEGIMKNSDRENLDGTLNLSYRLNKFNFSNQTNVYYTDIANNTVSFQEFSRANPFYSKKDENGEVYKILESYETIGGTSYVYNPLWDYQQKSSNGSNQLSLNNNFNIEYRPIEKLRINGKFGLNTERSKSEVFTSPFASTYTGVEQLKRGSYNRSDDTSTSYDGMLSANYSDIIGKHAYTFIGGAQVKEQNANTASYSTRGYITDQFSNPNFSTGYPDGGKPSSSIAKTRSASFYLNANYSYDMRYLIDFNARSDGSSVFGVNNPFSTTWSFGVAWNIHNEKIFKNSDIVNGLKLRYSMGNPGNQNINAKIANNVYTYYTSYQNMFGLAALVSQWGNKDLKWQRTLTHNIGININMFKSRLNIVLDHNIRKSDPLLLSAEQPTSTGSPSTPMNIGATKNQSWSLFLQYSIFKKEDLHWIVNISTLTTKTHYYNIGNILEKMNEEGRASQSLLRYYDGASSSAMWAVRSLGIDPMTGNEIFLKKDGTYTYKWDSSEEVICGDTTPDVEGNIGSTLRWKGFSFVFNFRYRWGGQAALNTLLNKVENISETSVKYNQDKRALYDRWQKPGDIAKFKRIDDTSTTNLSSRFIADDNTIECKTISVGYETTSAKWLSKYKLSSVTFRVYMNNVFRISTIKEERGLDYPFQRAISASLGLRF